MIRRNSGTIQLFSFDFWGTIVTPNSDFSRTRDSLVYEQLGCEDKGIDMRIFKDHFGAAKQKTERQSEREGRHIGLAERLGVLCVDLQLPVPSNSIIETIREEQRALSKSYPAHLYSDGIPNLFSDIRAAGNEIGLISNTGLMDGQDVTRILETHSLSSLIDYKLFSDRIGIAKPNPEIFYDLIRQASVLPESAVHTGDNKVADYDGPLAIGMRAIHASLDPVGIEKVRELL